MTQTTVLLTMHVESEGPGTLGSFPESAAAELRTVKLHRGQALPEFNGAAMNKRTSLGAVLCKKESPSTLSQKNRAIWGVMGR